MDSKIQWTNKTQNFWSGCQKVSAGCKFCYMHRIKTKKNQDPTIVHRSSPDNFYAPLNWKPTVIFTCSMSDFFIQDADQWREEAWGVIRETPHHRWQILTKRPERIMQCLPKDWDTGYKNVALGVTIENQETTGRMHILADIPAYVRFISAEPLLESVDLTIDNALGKKTLSMMNWIIIGGESGNETGKYRYRITEISWIERMINDVRANSNAGIFIKQLGTYQAKLWGLKHPHGGNIAEFPRRLQIRENPKF